MDQKQKTSSKISIKLLQPAFVVAVSPKNYYKLYVLHWFKKTINTLSLDNTFVCAVT